MTATGALPDAAPAFTSAAFPSLEWQMRLIIVDELGTVDFVVEATWPPGAHHVPHPYRALLHRRHLHRMRRL